MSNLLESKVRALEEKVRLLELENKDWTDRAEDVFLFASTSETIHKLESKEEIFEATLEKYSVMKDLPYSAIGKIENNNIIIISEYASFSENKNLAQISLSNSNIEMLGANKILASNVYYDIPGVTITFNEATFSPFCYLIFKIENFQLKNGVFILVSKTPFDQLENYKASVEHMITLINSRLDNLFLMDQLTHQNKTLEERVSDRTYELKESEEKYRQLIEQSNDAIYLLVNDTFEIINPRFTEIFGFTVDDVKAESFNFKDIITKKSLPLIEDRIARLNRGEKLENIYEFSAYTKSGKEVDCEVSTTYIEYKNGIATQGVIRDITEKKKIIQELVIAKEDAEKADKLKSEFLAQISHEIRTPINTILSFASLIKESVKDNVDTEIKDSIKFMNNAGRRITRTIDLIINMSEIQTGTLDYNPKLININKSLLSNLFLEFKYIALEKKIQVEMKVLTNNTNIIIDEYSVTQIFHNILDNSVKYTDHGKITIVIERDEQMQLTVSIKDTGIGIAQEFIPNLFKAFTQEEQGYTRRFEGNGLGLALVKKYCDLNGASIFVESEKGKGTTFRVVFNNK